ncbi:hypothetical protein ACCO45_000003 [Purpureocillium lilacinum]|uniref:Uncharacterized protein n=1 Tax=Purpureocillium lilacinum TaxID=33203 RepID=A0ACC4EAM2_PURLI
MRTAEVSSRSTPSTPVEQINDVRNAGERKRMQNRLAQRAHRQRVKARLKSLESKLQDYESGVQNRVVRCIVTGRNSPSAVTGDCFLSSQHGDQCCSRAGSTDSLPTMFGFATPPGSHDGQCAYGNGFFRREATPKLDTPPTGYKEAPLRSSGYPSNSIHQHVSAVREPPLLISRRDSQDNAPNYAKDTPTSCEVFRDLPAGALGLERSRLRLLEPTVPGRPGAKANTQQNLSLHRVSEVDKLQDIVFSELMGHADDGQKMRLLVAVTGLLQLAGQVERRDLLGWLSSIL